MVRHFNIGILEPCFDFSVYLSVSLAGNWVSGASAVQLSPTVNSWQAQDRIHGAEAVKGFLSELLLLFFSLV